LVNAAIIRPVSQISNVVLCDSRRAVRGTILTMNAEPTHRVWVWSDYI
jgi:hypothetical protein